MPLLIGSAGHVINKTAKVTRPNKKIMTIFIHLIKCRSKAFRLFFAVRIVVQNDFDKDVHK